MAGSIKGIIVEIGGDTSGLQKALSKVNSATSSLSKELRGIDALLKFDPSNTELLAQKQTVLTDAINETENKLKLLKETQEKVSEAEANGAKISEENYRALQREIVNTENKLKNLMLQNSKWTKVGKDLETVGTKYEKLGSKIDSLANKLTKTLTTSIAGLTTVAIKEAVDFETAFAGVEKTVDGTEEQLEELKEGIKDMAKTLPSSTTEISAVAEAAGQLGIQTESILSFSKVMIDLGNSTNLSADEAATALAKFANITNMSEKDYSKLGSTIVALGNNFATTESDIVAMATRLAATGELSGLSQPQILSLATAMSSVGIEAEAGGSAMSKLLKEIQLATELGGDDLKSFASVAGMTANQFKNKFKTDAVGALSDFISGLQDTKRNGKSAIAILNEMGLTEVRLSNTILALSNSSDMLSESIELGNKAWDDNTALTVEAEKRYATTESSLKILLNRLKNIANNLGQKLLPVVNKIIKKVEKWTDKLDDLTDEEQENVIKIGLMIAALGPLVKIIGTVTSVTGKVTKGIGLFSQAIAVVKTGAKSATPAVNTIATAIKGITSPAGIAITALGALAAVIATVAKKAKEELNTSLSNVGQGMQDFVTGIDSANSYLDTFNSTMFASSEEQQNLKDQMSEIQSGITKIAKTAADERRDYTQQEITQLEEYFTKLRELKDRELEIQGSIAGAITQQAKTASDSFQGGLEEYKVLSQDWINTAQQQAQSQISLIQNRAIEEIALLNQLYGDKATLDNEEYAREYNAIQTKKDEAIAAAQSEVAEVTAIYSQGYLERAAGEESFVTKLEEINSQLEKEQQRHSDKMTAIDTTFIGALTSEKDELRFHNEQVKSIWANLYQGMSESEEKQLGSWLAMVAQTELYGGQIDEETQAMVDNILDNMDSLPKDTKKSMEETVNGMLEGLEAKEPLLYAKSTSIANGVLSRLRTAFDINSPSKETQEIFEYNMAGMIKGIDTKQKSLLSRIDTLKDKVLNSMNFGNMEIAGLGNKVMTQQSTIFTTPQITFNVQELDQAKLEQCFNYINNKFGSKY